MDTQAKHFLLCSVIEYAKQFSRSRRRASRLTARDIEQALFCLGLRPLYSSLALNGDETVHVTDFIGAEYEQPEIGKYSLTIVPDESWIDTLDSRENFKKRKRFSLAYSDKIDLSERTRMYIQKVVKDACFDAVPPADTDRFLAVWFMGLHFSETLQRNEADWMFVRQCLAFLDKAVSLFMTMSGGGSQPSCSVFADNRRFPKYLLEPWLEGLGSVIHSKEVITYCESPEQAELVQEACKLFIPPDNR